MKLSQRLFKIAELVPRNSIVGDIGTDHGYIPAYLVLNNISKKVIGTDISKGSLEKIIEFVKEQGIEDKVDSRLGDGLDPILEYEIDTVIIAGMGGLLIRDILEKDLKKTNSIVNFILQPMVAVKELRKYLVENSFEIIGEELVKEDGKFYEIIHAKRGKSHVDKELYYEISPLLIKDKHGLLKEFISFKLKELRAILSQVENIDTEKSRERYIEINEKILWYKEVLKEVESERDN
ncbi:MAG: class I SAM-dependent methyltransferase [Tissierellaceae bacterium]|nr:class I SAM-dependent methyltransferase [Tissierellaceae bacterium]